MKSALLFCGVMLLIGSGCTTETRTFSFSVKNELQQPISVCVTKSYGPLEPGWEAPEDLAGPPHPATDQTPPGKVIPPGKTLSAPPFTGEFDKEHGQAILRVYAGTPNLTQMNAISPGSANRLDVPLKPGRNRFDIKSDDLGEMVVAPSTQP